MVILNLVDKLEIVKRNTAELISEEELAELLREKEHPKAYIGFEVSGFLHLGTGIICVRKLADLSDAGFEVVIFLADWHSMINNKLGGNLEVIQEVGEAYFKNAMLAAGLQGKPRIKFVWASDLVKDPNYWRRVIAVAKNTTMQRMIRCLPIMGRQDDIQNEMESAFLFYPPMQCADIFEIEGGLDIAAGGLDQRRIHMLAREVAPKLGRIKPVVLHTPLLMGLKGPGERMDVHSSGEDLGGLSEAKMSKSDPSSAIFTHDSPQEILAKIKKAHCPERIVENNPIIEIAKFIHFPFSGSLKVERKPKFGGDIEITTFDHLTNLFTSGQLHPLDLKVSIANSLTKLLEPSRQHFLDHPDQLEVIQRSKVTK